MAEGSYSLMELRDLKRVLEMYREHQGRIAGEHEVLHLLENRSIGKTKGSRISWSRLGEDFESSRKAIAMKEAQEMELIRGLSRIPVLEITGREYIPCFKDLKNSGGWIGEVKISEDYKLAWSTKKALFDELTGMGFNVSY